MRNILGDRIVKAAFDEEAYSSLLNDIAEAIGARSFAAGWHYHDGTTSMLVDSGWSSDQVARYDADFAKTDIWSLAQLAHWKPNCATNLDHLVSEREYEKSEVWNEFFPRHRRRHVSDDLHRG